MVDPTTAIDLGFTAGMISAMRADPAGTRRAVIGTGFEDRPAWAAHTGEGCAALEGWSAALLGDVDGGHRAVAALERLDAGRSPLILRSALRTFAGHALLHTGEARALDVLRQARVEAVDRGEVWWLAETLRVLALAEQRFGDPDCAPHLLAESAALAGQQGARLLIDRLAAQG